MEQGLLHLHNLLRWIILILLLISIINQFGGSVKPRGSKDKKLGLFLLIAAHITLIIGLLQYFQGEFGFKFFKEYGAATVMKTPALRFWAVEHITGMLIAIILITVAYSTLKKQIISGVNSKKVGYLLLSALIIILLVVPWPFRENIGRPWFPGM